MNEQPPIPDAKLDVIYEDALHEKLNWSELEDAIEQALLVECAEQLEGEDGGGQASQDYLNYINETLGMMDHEEKVDARYSGLLYSVSDNDVVTENRRFVLDEEMTFEGAVYVNVPTSADDEPDRMIMFKFLRDPRSIMADHLHADDDPVDTTDVVWYAPLEGMLRLELMRQPMMAIVRRHKDAAAALLTNGFFLSSRREQVSQMQSIADNCYVELHKELEDEPVGVTCNQFLLRYDAKDDSQERESLQVNQPNAYVQGELVGVVSMDILRSQPRQIFRSAEQLTYKGVPYAMVRDGGAGTTAYIPLDDIIDLA